MAAGLYVLFPARAGLRLYVEDTGIGIVQDKLGHLFAAFSQGDQSDTRKYGGIDLGLSISRKLVWTQG